MDADDILLDHPHDFFRMRGLAVHPNTCFVMMPFAPEFDLVYETIERALEGLMLCKRADDLKLGHSIIERILRGIATAELIVADLTGSNPNVFYELGIAHTRTKNVLLLTRDMNAVPFDLRRLFCHTYDVTSEAGLRKLGTAVRRAAEDVLARRLPETLEGSIERTRHIVQLLRQRLNDPDGAKGLVIRVHAVISSIGNWGHTESEDDTAVEYGRLLEDERNLMIGLVRKGAFLQAIISPQLLASPEGTKRLRRLLDFLKRVDECSTRSQFVLSPTGGSNLLLLGEDVLFEGYKTGLERGFGWTAVYTDKNFLKARTRVFESLFESARAFTLQEYERYTDDGDEPERDRLREAVIHAVENTIERLEGGSR